MSDWSYRQSDNSGLARACTPPPVFLLIENNRTSGRRKYIPLVSVAARRAHLAHLKNRRQTASPSAQPGNCINQHEHEKDGPTSKPDEFDVQAHQQKQPNGCFATITDAIFAAFGTSRWRKVRNMTAQRPLDGKKILVIVGDIYEDLELWYPKLRLIEAGAEVVVAGPEAEVTYAGKNGYPCKSDAALSDMQAENFDGLVVPGGFMPDKLRRDSGILKLVRDFDSAGKLIAAICHGGWIPISAGVYRDVKVTGSLGIKDDLVNAGAIWVDEPVVIDRHHVSSRKPDDLPDFCIGMLQVLCSE